MVIIKVKNHKYDIFPSSAKNKKYVAYPIINGKYGKSIHFGSIGYEQYKDKIGFYKDLDHLDKKRRQNYRIRHSAIKKKDGSLAINDPLSPAFLSFHLLW